MAYQVGSHYQPQTSTGGECESEYAERFISRAKHSNPRNVSQTAIFFAKQAQFCSIFEYKVIQVIKQKLHIR
jgi:hypothetical protein